MATFDLHFHANIHRMPERNKRLRLKKIGWYLKHLGLDYLASTEHSYKKPLEAYRRLAEIAADLDTEIIPGVEAVSSEGIDIIFLYRTEEHLQWALSQHQTFRWSVRDVGAICRDTDAIAIVPHPFHMGRTSAGNILSTRAYNRLLSMADYVEIHNGSALNMDKRLSLSCARGCFKQTRAKLDKTLNLPLEARGHGLGWAVSSDAHYPGEQLMVGFTENAPGLDEAVFDFLKQRIRFVPHLLKQPEVRELGRNVKLLRDFQCVFKEGLVKECIKTKNWTQATTALCLSCGLLKPFQSIVADYSNEEERARQEGFAVRPDRILASAVNLLIHCNVTPNRISIAGVIALLVVCLLPPSQPILATVFMALFVLCAGIDGPLARRLDVIHDGGFALYYSVQVVDSLRRIYAFHDSKLKERRKAGDMEVALPGSLRQRGVSAGLRTL